MLQNSSECRKLPVPSTLPSPRSVENLKNVKGVTWSHGHSRQGLSVEWPCDHVTPFTFFRFSTLRGLGRVLGTGSLRHSDEFCNINSVHTVAAGGPETLRHISALLSRCRISSTGTNNTENNSPACPPAVPQDSCGRPAKS